MAPYATLADVEARYENTIPARREAWVQTLLDEAINLLDARLPTLRARYDAGDVAPTLVKKIVVDAVLWVVRAPSPETGDQLAASVASRQRPATNPAVIEFTAAELASLQPAGAVVSVGSALLAPPAWMGR